MMTGIRIASVEERGRPRAVLVTGDEVRFLRDATPDAPDDVRELIAQWDRWREAVSSAAQAPAATQVCTDEVKWLAPVTPRKLLCVGANYHDHVAEMDGPAGVKSRPAPFPYSFLKPPNALVGSGSSVARPSYGHKLDWEAELAIVIGDPAAAAGDDPLAAVFGYTILNDLSLRDFIPFPHALGLDAVVSKGFDGAAPMGPWITLAADVPDPQALAIELSISGELMQNSSTREMIFGIAELVSHYGRVLTLEPGDVIATGTPAGVGAARQPQRFLAPGDEIEVRIGELGCLSTKITAPVREDPPPTTIEVTA
ncbi:MAG: fumarylacetoacetate hydrolase family protein [Solirubrobacterales bacterium]|nr:fumarylacetoacetate hydrolase family protein [Solirubrobacterales bacterium]